MSMLLAAVALAVALHRPAAKTRPAARQAPLIVVDPGHGGKDSGARHAGVREDQVNLGVAYSLAAALRADGYRVVLTRSLTCEPVIVRRDTPLDTGQSALVGSWCRTNLRDRVLDAARRGESVFLSLHCDHYNDPSVYGPRTYYGRGSEVQKALAVAIQKELDPFRARPHQASASDHFVLLSQPAVPAVTVELGFISSPHDRALLEKDSYRREMAAAITRGLDAFARDHRLMPPPKVDPKRVDDLWRLTRLRNGLSPGPQRDRASHSNRK
jgi:N-acetylmuramoyl-L-alanine amidase